MAYQGVSPYLFANNLTNVQLLDDISGLFNGFVVTFNLTIDGVAFRPEAARGLFIVFYTQVAVTGCYLPRIVYA